MPSQLALCLPSGALDDILLESDNTQVNLTRVEDRHGCKYREGKKRERGMGGNSRERD